MSPFVDKQIALSCIYRHKNDRHRLAQTNMTFVAFFSFFNRSVVKELICCYKQLEAGNLAVKLSGVRKVIKEGNIINSPKKNI